MKKLMVFPFTYSNREILMYRKNIKGYTLAAAVVWNQADLQFITNKFGKATVVFITEEFEKALALCDEVLFMENGDLDISGTIYKDYIQKAFDSKKTVHFSKKLMETLENENYRETDVEFLHSDKKNYIKNIDVPAIGVMGLGDFCNKFCCEVEIASFFRQKGYSVTHFGSKDFEGMLGERRYPEFLYSQDYTVTQRILGWNKYLFELCNRDNPDLILLGMPGGIMPLNNKILNEFGEIPYIISNGIRIDEGILCSYFYEQVDQKYLTGYKNYCKYKLNCEIEWICVSNSSCRFDLDSEESILEYLHYDPEIADKMQVIAEHQENIRFLNILNDKSRDEMLNQLYEELTESVSAF